RCIVPLRGRTEAQDPPSQNEDGALGRKELTVIGDQEAREKQIPLVTRDDKTRRRAEPKSRSSRWGTGTHTPRKTGHYINKEKSGPPRKDEPYIGRRGGHDVSCPYEDGGKRKTHPHKTRMGHSGGKS